MDSKNKHHESQSRSLEYSTKDFESLMTESISPTFMNVYRFTKPCIDKLSECNKWDGIFSPNTYQKLMKYLISWLQHQLRNCYEHMLYPLLYQMTKWKAEVQSEQQ